MPLMKAFFALWQTAVETYAVVGMDIAFVTAAAQAVLSLLNRLVEYVKKHTKK